MSALSSKVTKPAKKPEGYDVSNPDWPRQRTKAEQRQYDELHPKVTVGSLLTGFTKVALAVTMLAAASKGCVEVERAYREPAQQSQSYFLG